MTFKNQNGVLIVTDGNRIVASTTSHVLESTPTGMRLTVGAYDFEFTHGDIAFWDLVDMLPK